MTGVDGASDRPGMSFELELVDEPTVWDAFRDGDGPSWLAVKDDRPLSWWERIGMWLLRRPDPRTVQVFPVAIGQPREKTEGTQRFTVSFAVPDETPDRQDPA